MAVVRWFWCPWARIDTRVLRAKQVLLLRGSGGGADGEGDEEEVGMLVWFGFAWRGVIEGGFAVLRLRRDGDEYSGVRTELELVVSLFS